jgi:hypothetical protein
VRGITISAPSPATQLMKKEFPPSHELKKAFSANKIIPAKYE